MKNTKSKATLITLEALIALSLAFAIVFIVHAIARAIPASTINNHSTAPRAQPQAR